jgi:Fur family ferric uptake transcriptional regulator
MPVKEVIKQLRSAGHKVTPQRVTIIKYFLESTEPVTPVSLYEKIHRIDPEIGEVTVYRTLNILSEMGLICMFHNGDNTHSYISRPPEHHGHLICSLCGRVVNFTNCNVAETEAQLVADTGFRIIDHRLDFYGICPDCNKKPDSK